MFALNQDIFARPFFQIRCRLLLLFLADRWGYSTVLYTGWTTTGLYLRAHSQLNWNHPTVFLTVFPHCPWPAGRVREGARSGRFRLCHTCCRTGLGEDQSQHQVGAAERAGDFWVVQQSDEAWLCSYVKNILHYNENQDVLSLRAMAGGIESVFITTNDQTKLDRNKISLDEDKSITTQTYHEDEIRNLYSWTTHTTVYGTIFPTSSVN